MLCCKPKKDSYEIHESDEENEQKQKNEKSNLDKKGHNSKVNEQTGLDNNSQQEVVEAPIEVKITEASLAEPKTETDHVKGTVNRNTGDKAQSDSENRNGDIEHSRKYDTQMSIASQLSVREDINQSRDQFFSSNSLNDPQLQAESTQSRSPLSTEERFAIHQLRVSQSRAASQIIYGNVMSAQQLQEAVSRLESVASKLESLAGAGIKPVGGAAPAAAAGGSDTVAPFVTVFDGILAGEFARYLDLSSQIGGDVQTQACMVKTAFQALRDFLVTVGKSKKPEQGVFQGLLSPMAQQIQSVTEFREKNRRSEFFNHISGIAESISAIGWVQVEKTPGPFVKDMMDSGIFYTNKVLKDYKEKDQKHVDWTKAWLGTLREMMAYIKEHHTTGCSWNAQGVDASVSAVKAQAPAAGGPPPPPPPGPPPPPPPANISSGGETAEADRGALFAELNRGGSVTSGLKKVTNDMMTHKNPALKATSKVPGVRTGPAPFKATVTSQPPKVAPKPSAAPAAKPPVLELQEKKWVVLL